MRLELKHLAAYLPYGLEVQWIRQDDKKIITSTLTISDYPFLITRNHAKPTLVPLSYLTKEIEHNGERFVPSEKLSNSLQMSLDMWDFKCFNVNDTKVSDYQKLLEWHFDVFELIEQGLAIDKNEIK